MAVERMRTCEDVGELAKELGVTRRCLYKWRAKLDLAEAAEELARPHTREASYRKQVRRLERLLAEKTLASGELSKYQTSLIRPCTGESPRTSLNGGM